MRVADIQIVDRNRKDVGDIRPLADSINEFGLLQPIGVTVDCRLVFGARRVQAFRLLGRETIPARIVEINNIMLGEMAENLVRKEYTISERVAIVETMRSFEHGGDRRSDRVRNHDVETLQELAKRAGLGGKDGYYRAKAVIDHGVPELVDAMDQRVLSVSKAAEISELSEDDQRESVRRGRKTARRDPDDYYPTPPEVTEALLEKETFQGNVWEPACGEGAISRVLEAAGYEVISSDLIDRGYGEANDFLTSTYIADNIVTNPPFKIAEPFIEKALACSRRKVALFLPLTFLASQRRNALLQRSPLRTVYVFSNRISLYPPGSKNRDGGRIDYAWYVWEHDFMGRPQIGWISTNSKRRGASLTPKGKLLLPASHL